MPTDRSDITLAYTLALLDRLDVLIRREIVRMRHQRPRRADDEFRGLCISDEDVDALLDRTSPSAEALAPATRSDKPATDPDHALAAADAHIAILEAAAAKRGETLRLDHVVRSFGLTEFERQVLVIALAAELNLKFELLFGYLQDDVTKKRPTIDLVLRLLCPALPDRLAARAAFESGAPLLRWQLVALHEDPGARHPVLLARYLKLDERIAAYLLGRDAIDSRLDPLVAFLAPEERYLSTDVREHIGAWARNWAQTETEGAVPIAPLRGALNSEIPWPVVLLHGRYGTGRRAAAAFLASSLDRRCLLLDIGNRSAGELGLRQLLVLAEREALLSGAVLCWYRVTGLLQPDPDREAEREIFLHALARGRALTVLLGELPWEPGRNLERRPFFRLEIPETTYAERRMEWAAGLNGMAAGLSEHALSALAGRFRLTAGQIGDALARARTVALARDPVNGHLTPEDIDAACRAQAQQRLDALARKLTPRYGWSDIVLPPNELATLHLISSMIRQRATVYGTWGFDRKLALGKGVMALFAGPSGTGKTMAAEVIARDLGLDLYRIDLSAVVNKYIGETEKNLERLFTEAQHTDAILFFDEADALFGKRSGVSDAHDRYANIETAYLLQRTEAYDGLVILASNLPKNLDDAFMRRLHFSVAFREPDEKERLEIWQRTFPLEAPKAEDLDLPLLARRFKITGGNIRNIVLGAAFLAAEEGESIAMRHLLAATRQELRKMGRMLHETDFVIHVD